MLNSTQLRLMEYLILHIKNHEYKVCQMNNKELGAKLHVSQYTVKSALKKLKEQGLIKVSSWNSGERMIHFEDLKALEERQKNILLMKTKGETE